MAFVICDFCQERTSLSLSTVISQREHGSYLYDQAAVLLVSSTLWLHSDISFKSMQSLVFYSPTLFSLNLNNKNNILLNISLLISVYSQSTINKMRLFSVCLFLSDNLHVSDSFSFHHQELKNCTYSVRYLSGKYLTLYVQFLSSWWWTEKLSETCRVSYGNKRTEKSRILLVVFWEYISDARTYEC